MQVMNWKRASSTHVTEKVNNQNMLRIPSKQLEKHQQPKRKNIGKSLKRHPAVKGN